MAELVVHGVEIVGVQVEWFLELASVGIINIGVRHVEVDVVDAIEHHLHTLLGSTHHDATLAVVLVGANQLDDTGSVGPDECLVAIHQVVVHIEPQELYQFGNGLGLLEVGGNHIVVLVGFLVEVAILETDVIGLHIVLQQPQVKFVFLSCFF